MGEWVEGSGGGILYGVEHGFGGKRK